MSRAGTILKEEEEITSSLPRLSSLDTMWTEPVSIAITVRNVCQVQTEDISSFGRWTLLDKQARVMAASLYKIAQKFSQTTIAPIQLMSLSFLGSHSHQEMDLWIEMPPRSVQNVIANVKYTGRGEPPDFSDELLDE